MTELKLIKPNSDLKKKWDIYVDTLSSESMFMYSYILDAVSSDWKLLMNEDEKPLFPIVENNVLNIKRAIQPLFTRYFKSTEYSDEIELFLKEKYHYLELRFSSNSSEDKFFQLLETNAYQPNQNVKRLVKKSLQSGYFIKEIDDYNTIIEIFRKETLAKIDSLKNKDLDTLKNLCNALSINHKLKILGVFKNEKFLGGAMFFTHKERMVYIKGAVEKEAKMNGAMFFLLDFAIRNYSNQFELFDFGGSSVDSVAAFNRKFGAKDTYYKVLYQNKLPLWFKLLKKMIS